MTDYVEKLSMTARTAIVVCVFLLMQTFALAWWASDTSSRLASIEVWINTEPIRAEAREARLRDLEREGEADRVRFEHIMSALAVIQRHTKELTTDGNR